MRQIKLYMPHFPLSSGSVLLHVASSFLSALVVLIVTRRREAARRRKFLAAHLPQKPEGEVSIEQVHHLRNQFLEMAAHELKTPLTTIVGLTQLLVRRLSREPELSDDLLSIKAILEKIEKQLHRLNSFINDLLNLSHLRSGKVSLHLTDADLIEECREVIEEQQLLSGRRIELETTVPYMTLHVDHARLHQAITNVVSNAWMYSPQDSPVEVSINQKGKNLLIRVHNTGKGIAREQMAHIFEPFYRSPGAYVSPERGMGLGLAITKEIVERHYGSIRCHSEVGRGTTFEIELPLS